MWQLCTLGFVQVRLAKRLSLEDRQPCEDKVFFHLLPRTGAALVAWGHPVRWGRFLCRGTHWQDSGQWAQAGTQGVVLKREKSDCCETARGHRLPRSLWNCVPAQPQLPNGHSPSGVCGAPASNSIRHPGLPPPAQHWAPDPFCALAPVVLRASDFGLVPVIFFNPAVTLGWSQVNLRYTTRPFTTFILANSKLQEEGKVLAGFRGHKLRSLFGQFSEVGMSMLLFTFPVRGSEGLYMVNGPPAFTESTAFQRYCYSDGLWPCVPKKCPNLEGTHEGQGVQIWTGSVSQIFFWEVNAD